MGDRLTAAKTKDEACHIGTYSRKPVLFVRGEGMRLFDDDGREYLDFVSGIGVVNLGHAHPAVAEAVCEQMGKLVHVSNLYYCEHQGELAEDIAALAGGARRVFFANSGAEANEGAIKLARRWGKQTRGSECVEIVTATRSFHGRTLATLAATGQPAKHEPFQPLPPGFSHVPFNDIEALADAVTDKTCAVLLEPVQGEGGVYPAEFDYLSAVAELCSERDVLCMLDEVQTGCYRTGPGFAHQAYGVTPDVFTLAKAVANGLPMGAVVASEEVACVFGPGDHATTFGGGPVVSAAARATLAALASEQLGENAIAVGEHIRAQARSIAERTGAIADVRGAGLMVGIELSGIDAGLVAESALAKGIVINNIGSDVLRFLPPLCCTKDDADEALGVVEETLIEMAG